MNFQSLVEALTPLIFHNRKQSKEDN